MKEKDLNELQEIHEQIANLQTKAKDIIKKQKEHVLDDMKAKIKLYVITPKELGFSDSLSNTNKKTSTVSIKYKQGDKKWTGRGRKPKFIVDYLESGGKIDELLVN